VTGVTSALSFFRSRGYRLVNATAITRARNERTQREILATSSQSICSFAAMTPPSTGKGKAPGGRVVIASPGDKWEFCTTKKLLSTGVPRQPRAQPAGCDSVKEERPELERKADDSDRQKDVWQEAE
jgi:hypothetical protein